MQRHLVIVMGLIALALSTGCNRNSPASAPPLSAPAIAPQRTVAKTLAKPEDRSGTSVGKSISVDKAQPRPIQAAADRTKNKEKIATNQSERMAILTPGGPIVVDVLVTIDGRPLADVFEEVVHQVLNAATPKKDGHPTWKDLAANKEYLTAQGENMASGVAAQLKMWIERFDQNRDGQIQRDEAAAWLGRDTGVSARAFDVRGSRSYISVPSATSRIWKLLDADHNNRLSKAEIARAAATLLSLDENDDGIVAPEELATVREQLRVDGDQGSTVTASNGSYAAVYLAPQYEVDRLEYLLGDLYAQGQVLRPTSFPALATAYKKLDVNGDDQLTQNELAAMATMNDQLRLAVEFRHTGAKHQASLAIVEHSPEIGVLQTSGDRVVVTLGSTRIVVSALDLSFGETPPSASTASQIRMVVHDQCDALGEVLDVDGDGQIGEREIATCADRLSRCDINHDGQISNDELPYSMLATIVRGERPGEQSLYRPVFTATSPAVVDAPSWFLKADYNGDGEISRREFLGTAEQFSLLDENGDGYISPGEAKHRRPAVKANTTTSSAK